MALQLKNYDPALMQGATVDISLSASNIDTETGLDMSDADSLTTGTIANFTSNSSDTGTRTLIKIVNDNTAATGATGLNVQQDAAATAVNIDHNAATGSALVIDGEQTTAVVVDLSAAVLTQGKVIDISDLAAITTGKVIHIDATGITQTSGILVHIDSAGTVITGAGRLFLSDHTGATTTNGILNEFKSAANDETVVLQVTADSLTSGKAAYITANALDSGKALDISNLSALTTGKGIHVDADGTTQTSGILVHLDSAGTAITGAGRLFLSDHTGATTTNGILNEFKTAANDETVLAEFDAASLTSGVVVDVIGTALDAGTALDIGDVDAITTGKAINIQSTSTAFTSGILLDIGRTASADTLAATTGNIAKFASSLDELRATGTTTSDYDTVLISRTSINTTAGGTHSVAGAALKIETTSTETAGTLTDATYGIEIAHNARHDSADIYGIKITADNPGTNAAGGIDLSAFAAGEPTINFPAGNASSIEPQTSAETGWINVAVAGTVRYIPFYAAS